MEPSRRRAGAVLLAWLGFLAGALGGLHAVGGHLAPPPLTALGDLGPWLDARQPPEAAFAVGRLVVLGLAWYLLVATAAGAFARLSRVPALIRAADLFTVPSLRRLVNTVAGVSIAGAATFTGSAGLAAAADDRAPAPAGEVMTRPTMTRLPEDTGVPASPAPPTLRRLPDEPAAESPVAIRPSWEVRAGHHFWAVAEEVLTAAWPRPPSDAEVDSYWHRLVEANRAILADPSNPDLLYPGQMLTVPPPPPISGR